MAQERDVKITDIIPPKFHDVWRAAFNPDILHVVCKGGRGSGKSSDIGHIVVQMIMRYPVNAVCIRKVDRDLQESVFEQIMWAIEEQGVRKYFKVNKSPLKITYLPRGNQIIFRGLQDPNRLKSLKSSRFPYAIAWVEELAEFKTEEEIKIVTNSIVRGELPDGLFYKFFYSYNPPKRKQSWVNKKYNTALLPANTFVHHSTYLDNPWISQAFIEEAEATRQRSQRAYDWEYMGLAVGSGVVPFENLVFTDISDDLYNSFDNIRQGVDFGYANDPLAFVRWHYDKKRRRIYAMDEHYGVKISNRALGEWLKSKGYNQVEITADSAEPKSIDELIYEHGISRVRGAKKGPDSREYGERWLDD
ncbi:MAG: PBSX family phage terminase large subunit, partial [Catonella sp.]